MGAKKFRFGNQLTRTLTMRHHRRFPECCPELRALPRMVGFGAPLSREFGNLALQPLDSFRNERNIVARRPKTAQVAAKRAWHEAEHANVHQRDDPTWISSFPRVAKSMPDSWKQRKNNFGPCPRNVAYVA